MRRLAFLPFLLILTTVACEQATEPEIQLSEPLTTAFTVVDEAGNVLSQFSLPGSVSIPEGVPVRVIDGEPAIVISTDLLKPSMREGGPASSQQAVSPGGQPPTVLGDYTVTFANYILEDLVSVVETPAGAQGLINHKAGVEEAFAPFSTRPLCMASVEDWVANEFKALIMMAPLGAGGDPATAYTVVYYADGPVGFASSIGTITEETCDIFGASLAYALRYLFPDYLGEVTAGRLQLFF